MTKDVGAYVLMDAAACARIQASELLSDRDRSDYRAVSD